MSLPKRPTRSLLSNNSIDPGLIDQVVADSTKNRVAVPTNIQNAVSARWEELPIQPSSGWKPVTYTPEPGVELFGFQGVLTPDEYENLAVFALNPRNYESIDNDSALFDSELYESIKEKNQNSMPAISRFVDGIIEIISGSRRFYNARKAKANFLLEVYFDVSESTAEYLTYVENLGRAEIGVLAYAKFISFVYQREIKNYPDMTLKTFAKKWGITRDSLTRYFRFAELPEYLVSAADYKKDDLWSWRKATEMRKLYEAITDKSKGWSKNTLTDDELKSKIHQEKEEEKTKGNFSSPTKFNKYLKKIAEEVNGEIEVRQEEKKVINIKKRRIKCLALESKGALKVEISFSPADENNAVNFASELEELIVKYNKMEEGG